MSKDTSQFVDTPEVRIEYMAYGEPTGTPVVLLHGFPDSPVAYEAVISHLDGKGLRLIVPYLRGYGGSEVKAPELIGGQEAALGKDLLSFADALALERFHVVGHDWGARTSYAAAVLAPERIASMVTMATPYVMFGGKQSPPAQIQAHWYQWFFQMHQAEKVLKEDAEAFCHRLWRAWSPGWDFARSEFAAAAKAWENPQFAATVLHYYRTRWSGALSLRAYEGLQAKLNADPKPRISVPTLYIQGGADACDLAACSEDQASFFAGPYERLLLKKAGHFPHREEPGAVASAIERHLAKYAVGAARPVG